VITLDVDALAARIEESAAQVRELAGTPAFVLLRGHLALLQQAVLLLDLTGCNPDDTPAHQARFNQLRALDSMLAGDPDNGR
jgi:hypothetical protein